MKDKTVACPSCGQSIPYAAFASTIGSKTSDAKKQASRNNGKQGGRPPKNRK